MIKTDKTIARIGDEMEDTSPKNQRVGPVVPMAALVAMDPIQRASTRVSPRSKFGDSVWDLSDAEKSVSRGAQIINFNFGAEIDLSASPLLDSVKFFIYSLLVDPPNRRLRNQTIAKNVQRGGLRSLVGFMIKNGINQFRELSLEDFELLLNELKNRQLRSQKVITDRTLMSRVRGIDYLFLQSTKLPDSICFNPWVLHRTAGDWSRSAAVEVIERGVLRTPAIPDDIVAQLIKRSILIVKDAPRLADAILKYRELKDRFIVEKAGRYPNGAIRYKRTRPNFDLSYHHLQRSYVHLRSATAILVGLLTGMRPGEILSIPSDVEAACKEEIFDINGTEIKCFFVNSELRKNLPSPTVMSWQTVPLVLEAIKSLAAVNKALMRTSTPFLFIAAKSRQRAGNNYEGRILNSGALSYKVRDFIRFYGISKKEWSGELSGRSLRRTFARITTRNGLGLIELQDQLKHFDPDITRMYGQPSITLHMHEEKVALSEELYQELLSGVMPIVGGGAKQMNQARDQFSGLTRADKSRFVKSLASNALIDQVEFGLCTYRPDRALCGGHKANCKPDECLNSIVPLDSIRRSLQNRHRENERLLKLTKGSALKKEHLMTQIRMIKNLLEQASGRVSPQIFDDGKNK